MSESSGPEKTVEHPKISVTIQTDVMTNTFLKDANLLIVAMPLSLPKYVALGFLWTVLNEITAFYEALERQMAQKKNNGIVRAGFNEAMALGKKLIS